MITDTRDRIVSYITNHKQARVHDLARWLGISNMAVHKHLKRLVGEGVLQKAGKPPLVFYMLSSLEQIDVAGIAIGFELDEKAKEIIENNFLHITPDGKLLYGLNGFIYWKRLYQSKKSFSVLIEEYVRMFSEKQKYLSKDGWIDATEKVKNTFIERFVDRLLYADIYSVPVFGRTKLAKLVMHAKQAESRELMEKICVIVKPLIERVIEVFDIEAVGYIPPTVPRPVQFVDELSKRLDLRLPHINLVKALAGSIPVAQKTLARLDERILNAQSTIFIKYVEQYKFGKILLIDDVAGSGASFHETAKKLRAVGIGDKSIVAFALVGNIKGFDVIRQM